MLKAERSLDHARCDGVSSLSWHSGCLPIVGRHKDYVYQKRLAHTLPLDSYRFDFRYAPSFCPLPLFDSFSGAQGKPRVTGYLAL
jgi:hypothetical protein